MVKAGAPLTAIDRSGQSVIDAAATCDAELLHHLLIDGNLAPVDALVHAIKHGDTFAATVSPNSPETFVVYQRSRKSVSALVACPLAWIDIGAGRTWRKDSSPVAATFACVPKL